MKRLVSIALLAIVFLSSCKKGVDDWDRVRQNTFSTHPLPPVLALHPITINLHLSRDDRYYELSSRFGEQPGNLWTSTVPAASPRDTPDNGTFVLYNTSYYYDTIYGTITLQIHREKAQTDGIDYWGTGTWVLTESTGIYKQLKFAKGMLKYKESHPDIRNGGEEDYMYIDMDLNGFSN